MEYVISHDYYFNKKARDDQFAKASTKCLFHKKSAVTFKTIKLNTLFLK